MRAPPLSITAPIAVYRFALNRAGAASNVPPLFNGESEAEQGEGQGQGQGQGEIEGNIRAAV